MLQLRELIQDAGGRLSLGPYSPIGTAVVLGGALPLLSSVLSATRKKHFANSVLHGTLFFVGGVVSVLIGATGTRGVCFAIPICFAMAAFWAFRLRDMSNVLFYVSNASILIATFASGPNATRLANTFSNTDDSFWNRVALWKAAFRLISTLPAFGIDARRAHELIGQWIGEFNTHYLYATVFNDFLQVGCTNGFFCFIVYLGVVVGCCIFPIFVLNREQLPKTHYCLGFLVSLQVLFCAALTTSFEDVRAARWIVTFDLMWIVLVCFAGGLGRMLLGSVIKSLAALGILYFLAFNVHKADAVVFKWERDTFRMVKNGFQGNRSLIVLPDITGDGFLYGHTIKRMFLASERYRVAVIPDPRVPLKNDLFVDAVDVLMVGRACRKVSAIRSIKSDRVIFLFPSDPPNREYDITASSILLALPSSDPSGINAEWVKWAANHHAAVVVTTGTINDLDSVPCIL